MNSDVYNIWSLANDTEKTVEALHSDVKKVSTSSYLSYDNLYLAVAIGLTSLTIRFCL
jgi:hypothetical protein